MFQVGCFLTIKAYYFRIPRGSLPEHIHVDEFFLCGVTVLRGSLAEPEECLRIVLRYFSVIALIVDQADGRLSLHSCSLLRDIFPVLRGIHERKRIYKKMQIRSDGNSVPGKRTIQSRLQET